MARQDSRVTVIDSTMAGEAKPLKHSVYAIVYVPSWLLMRDKFDWSSTSTTLHTLEVMKEYFTAAPIQERPLRAQRCLYSIKSLQLYKYRSNGQPRFSELCREQLRSLSKRLSDYLSENTVVAWDWIVSWSECRAMAEAFPNEYVRLYRQLRARRDYKRQPKPELQYYLNIMETVAREKEIDMERKQSWKYFGP